MMELVELTTTPAAALPLMAFKSHLRLGYGFSDDGLQDEVLEGFLRVAIAAIEARIGKNLFERRMAWVITRWMEGDAQPLPVAPVSQIEEITLISPTGVESTLGGDVYVLERDAHRPKILARGRQFPAIARGGSAMLTFTAGFGTAWGDIPATLRQGVLMLGAYYYENRHEQGGVAGAMPFGVTSLLEPHRNIRLMGARI